MVLDVRTFQGTCGCQICPFHKFMAVCAFKKKIYMKTLNSETIEHWPFLAVLPLLADPYTSFYLPSVTAPIKKLLSRAEHPVAESHLQQDSWQQTLHTLENPVTSTFTFASFISLPKFFCIFFPTLFFFLVYHLYIHFHSLTLSPFCGSMLHIPLPSL